MMKPPQENFFDSDQNEANLLDLAAKMDATTCVKTLVTTDTRASESTPEQLYAATIALHAFTPDYMNDDAFSITIVSRLMNHIRAIFMMLKINGKSISPLMDIFTLIQEHYPQHYDAYCRDISRIAYYHGLQTPDYIPLTKDLNFEDPFNLGIHNFRKFLSPLKNKKTYKIDANIDINTLPGNMSPMQQEIKGNQMLRLITPADTPESADALWELYKIKFDKVDVQLKFYFLFTIYQYQQPSTFIQNFTILLEEFFENVPSVSRNNIRCLITNYYGTVETSISNKMYTYALEHSPTVKQHFLKLALEGTPAESAFAMKILAIYCNAEQTEDRMKEIINTLFPNGVTTDMDKVRFIAFISNIQTPDKKEIANRVFLSQQNAHEQEQHQNTPAQGYRLQISQVIKDLLERIPDQDEEIIKARIQTFTRGLDTLFARLEKKEKSQGFSMIKTIAEMAPRIEWSTTKKGSLEKKILIAQDDPSAHFCITAPNSGRQQHPTNLLDISTKDGTVNILPHPISEQYASMITVFALTTIHLREKEPSIPVEGSPAFFRIYAMAYWTEINTLRLINPDLDDFCMQLLTRYHISRYSNVSSIFQHKNISKIMDKFNREYFGNQPHNKTEDDFRRSTLALALQFMLAKLKSTNLEEIFDEITKIIKHEE